MKINLKSFQSGIVELDISRMFKNPKGDYVILDKWTNHYRLDFNNKTYEPEVGIVGYHEVTPTFYNRLVVTDFDQTFKYKRKTYTRLNPNNWLSKNMQFVEFDYITKVEEKGFDPWRSLLKSGKTLKFGDVVDYHGSDLVYIGCFGGSVYYLLDNFVMKWYKGIPRHFPTNFFLVERGKEHVVNQIRQCLDKVGDGLKTMILDKLQEFYNS